MKIIDCKQRSPEWFAARASCVITASQLTPACAPEMRVRMSCDELRAELDRYDIEHAAEATHAELVALLPEPDSYRTMSEADRRGRDLLIARRMADDVYENDLVPGWDWLIRLRKEKAWALDANPAVQRGIELEDEAIADYLDFTGYHGRSAGFVLHESGGFGASPDLLVEDPARPGDFSHGVEIKCPLPELHMEWLLAGTLPEQHRLQVHGSMAVTGLPRWDFYSFCPGAPSLHIIVPRDDFTERVLSGLLLLQREYQAADEKMDELYAADDERYYHRDRKRERERKSDHGKEAAT